MTEAPLFGQTGEEEKKKKNHYWNARRLPKPSELVAASSLPAPHESLSTSEAQDLIEAGWDHKTSFGGVVIWCENAQDPWCLWKSLESAHETLTKEKEEEE